MLMKVYLTPLFPLNTVIAYQAMIRQLSVVASPVYVIFRLFTLKNFSVERLLPGAWKMKSMND